MHLHLLIPGLLRSREHDHFAPALPRLAALELLLADARLLAITHEEADALVQSLNSHFAADGFSLQAQWRVPYSG